MTTEPNKNTKKTDEKLYEFKAPDGMELAKEELEKINKYDEEKMMSDFQLREAIKTNKKEKLKKVTSLNKKYPKQVIIMRDKVKEDDIEKLNKINDYITKKEQLHNRNIEELKNSKNIKNNKELKERKERTNNVRKKLERNLYDYEQKRVEEEKRTQDRIDMFTKRSEDLKSEKQKGYEEKIKLSNSAHLKNLEEKDKIDLYVIKEREDKIFERYASNFWAQKKKKKDLKDKKKSTEEHIKRLNEQREEVELKRLENQQKYIQKLNDMSKKRKILEAKKQSDYNNIIKQQKEKLEKTKQKIEDAKKDEEKFRETILELQRSHVSNGINKDDDIQFRRAYARDKIVSTQMEIESRLNQFNKDMNKLKDNSILKKSFEQRKKMYLDKKKKEEEERKKELEDKANNK